MTIPNKKAGITLYGGEPLMNYTLIRQSVEYIKANAPVPIILNMTTNGYYLTDEIMEFITENNIHLAVSIDGSEKNHDRNRILPHNHKTHSKVMENIRRFMEKYPSYPNIGLICVYDTRTDLEENEKFFMENILPPIYFINEVSATNTDYYDRFTKEEEVSFHSQYSEMLEKYIHAKQHDLRMSSYLQMLFEAPLSLTVMRLRHKDIKSDLVPFTNTCVPGMKISVRTDGKYDICERINSLFPIGSVEEGIDSEKVINIVNRYNTSVTAGCHECISQKNCPLCFAYTNGNYEFRIPDNFCSRWCDQLKDRFSVIYTILEKNPRAFDMLQNSLERTFMFQS